MKSANEALLSTLARDLMVTDVITIDAEAPIDDAVRILDEDDVSGLPVVEASGKLVGMITSHDLARIDHERGTGIDVRPSEPTLADVIESDVDDVDAEAPEFRSKEGLPEAVVRDFMTPTVITVEPTATLQEICRVLARENIHRVIVTDENDRLAGIVTSTDVVRCIADA